MDYASLISGKEAVTVVTGKTVQGHLGGTPVGFVPSNAKTVTFSFHEIFRFFCIFGCIPFVTIGRTIWLLLSGDRVKAGEIPADHITPVSYMDLFPSVMEYLGIEVESNWGIDGVSRLQWEL